MTIYAPGHKVKNYTGVYTTMVSEKDPEIKKKLKEFMDAFKEAKLVGCVSSSMLLGEVKCPLIAFCEQAPKKDIQDGINQATNYDSIYGQDSRETSLEFIKDAWKLLEEAIMISYNCPLKKAVFGR